MRAIRAALCAFALAGAAALHAEPTLVILVRHAEKAEGPHDDPGLSEAGQRRAEALAQALSGAGIAHIVTTQWQRTRRTAAPLAAQLGIEPTVVATRKGAAHAAQVAAAVRALSGRVLVVGHSNTVPDIAAALAGVAPLPPLCETSYSHLFVVHGGPSAALLRLRYGAPDAVLAGDCL